MKLHLMLSFLAFPALAADLHWVDDAVLQKAKQALVRMERTGKKDFMTGFFASADGMIVTIASDLEGATGVIVHTGQGKKISVNQLLALDRESDLAVLATGTKPAEYLAVPSEPARVGEACAMISWLEDGRSLVSDGQLLARHKGIDRTGTRLMELWSVGINLSSAVRTASPVIARDGRIAGLLSHYRPSHMNTRQRLALAIPEAALASILNRAREAPQRLPFPAGDPHEHDTIAFQDPDYISAGELAKSGNLTAVMEKYRSTLKRHPQSTSVMRDLAAVLLNSGDLAGAQAMLKEARRMAPTRLDLRELEAGVMAKAGDVAGAMAFARTFTSDVPNYGEAWHSLGDSLLMLQRNDEAVAAFRRWTEVEPELMMAWLGYQTALSKTGNREEESRAREHYNELDDLCFKLRYSAPKRE